MIGFVGGPKFDPSLTWKVIKTPHFLIYYHQGEEASAKKAADIAEEIHPILTKRIGWEPAEPTHLVLLDHTDATFGAMLPFPHNTIYIALTPPLSNTLPFPVRLDDWLREVITHEYVHVLQIDMNTGFTSIVRTLFGRQPFPLFIFNSALPNLWQPAWLIEGLATYEETALGVSDRRDSAYSEMILRMAVLEDQFPTFDQGNGRDTWPGHQIEYIFGAAFYRYLAGRFGERALKEISLKYSDNVFPFFVDTTAREIFGQSYLSLWSAWQKELKVKYEQQRKELERQGWTAGTPLTEPGYYQLGPQGDPQGRRVVYTRVDPHEEPSLRIKTLDSGKDHFLLLRNGGFTASWSRDGNRLVFSQPEVYRNYSFYNDLYLYDLREKRLNRLTNGARLRDPDFHPDGTRLIAVENALGKSRLVLYDLAARRLDPLDWIEEGVALTHPRWSPDGRRVAVTAWKEGAQGIYLVDPEARRLSPILMDRPLDLNPTWSGDGKYLLFSSERTGIYNLFAYEVEMGNLFQVTHLLGGAFTPAITSDGMEIFFSSYSSSGFGLHRMAWDPSAWKRIDRAEEPPPAAPQAASANHRTESYSPWPTLRPRFWTPLFGYDEDDGFQLGAFLGGADILGRHRFDALGIYNFRSDRTDYSVQYFNDSFHPTWHLGYSSLEITHPDLLVIEDYREKRQRFDVDVTLPQFRFHWSQALMIGYRFDQLSSLTDLPDLLPTEAPVPHTGTLSGLRVVWHFGSSKEYGFSTSREDGRTLLLSYERFDKRLGSDFDQNRYIAAWREYLGFFWQHHILATRLTGGVANGDPLVQRAFQIGGPNLTEELLNPEQTEFFLRGYPSRHLRGQRAALGTVEYRFPVWNLERGIWTWPFFIERFHGALFYDIGNAWDEETDLSEFRRAVGSEIKTDMIFGYRFYLRLRLGVAHGLDEDGETQVYFTAGNSF